MNEISEVPFVAITGGASGIGRAIADQYRASGAKVAICDVSSQAVDAYAKDNPEDIAIVANIASCSEVDSFFDEIEARFGSLTVLVNSACIAGPTATLEDIDPEAWKATLDVGLTGPFLCSRRAVPLMKKAGGGAIINIASSAAFFGYPHRSPYVASKWAMIGLTKTWAMELGQHNIRVNAVCPGSVEGERIESVLSQEAESRSVSIDQVRSDYVKHTSLKTFIPPEDIASMVLYLSSPAGKRISGQAIGVDGHQESLSQTSS